MPELDTPASGNPQGGAAPESQDDTPDVFLKTKLSAWKTQEDAAKGVEELQEKLQSTLQQVADLKAQAQSQAAQQEVLNRIAENTARPDDTDAEREARLQRLREEAAEDPGRLVDFMADLTQQGEKSFAERMKALDEEVDRRVKEQVDAIAQQFGQFKLSQDPVYQKYEAEVKETMTEFNVSEDQAIKIVAKLHANDEPTIESDRFPGSMSSDRLTGAGTGKVSPEMLELFQREAAEAHPQGSDAFNTLVNKWSAEYLERERIKKLQGVA